MRFTDELIEYLKVFSQDGLLYEYSYGNALCCSNPYNKEECLKLEKQLNAVGYITKIGRNSETKKWSVAIIGKGEDINEG